MRDFTLRKRIILTVLWLLVAADLGLAVYSYGLAAAPYTPQKQFDDQNVRLKILQKDIASAEGIKTNMPSTRADCEKFERGLPLESVGSSSMTADLDGLARKAGLQILTFTVPKQKELSGHPITEVQIDMTVNGNYASVARFINDLQRSDKFYIVDDLNLTEAQSKTALGNLSVVFHLRTYFREAA